ncbi:MAG: transglutaminase-like domain-containing protein [Candidatus Saelkia tenebricola]|nr:transglutaminase-like domain-containing protein [Candidatus Saelkia tenebricola]
MLRKLIFIFTAILWVFTLFLFYKKEILPGKRVDYPYREFLTSDLFLKEEWFGIYFNQNKIGYANFTVGLDSVDADTEYKINGEAFVVLPVLGVNKKSWVQIKSHVDLEYRLKDFYFLFLAEGLRTEIKAKRIGDYEFELEIKEGVKISKSVIELPKGVVLSGIFGPLKEFKNPVLGRKIKFYTFNPLTLKSEEVYAEVVAREEVRFDDELREVYIVKTKFSGLESESWLDEDGRLLREESPLGINIVREPQMKALGFLGEVKDISWDLAKVFSLSSNVQLESLRINSLTVLLRGKNLDSQKILNGRQKILGTRVLKNGVKEICLKITKDADEISLENREKYLKSDNFIQTQDPEIKALAKHLTENSATEISKAKDIAIWVYNYLEKKITLSIPSALNALNLGQGDCNEHTFLFTAISRSAGIPTKIKNGLVYIEERFYYHSWPSVYVDNRWIDIDPTLNQFPADPTHIMLVEGELSEQFDILKILGKIEIEVKDYE